MSMISSCLRTSLLKATRQCTRPILTCLPKSKMWKSGSTKSEDGPPGSTSPSRGRGAVHAKDKLDARHQKKKLRSSSGLSNCPRAREVPAQRNSARGGRENSLKNEEFLEISECGRLDLLQESMLQQLPRAHAFCLVFRQTAACEVNQLRTPLLSGLWQRGLIHQDRVERPRLLLAEVGRVFIGHLV